MLYPAAVVLKLHSFDEKVISTDFPNHDFTFSHENVLKCCKL